MEDEENFDILNNEENLEPIDGQIGIEELYIREEEAEEIEEVDNTPIDGQVSMEDMLKVSDSTKESFNENDFEKEVEQETSLEEENVFVEENFANKNSFENDLESQEVTEFDFEQVEPIEKLEDFFVDPGKENDLQKEDKETLDKFFEEEKQPDLTRVEFSDEIIENNKKTEIDGKFDLKEDDAFEDNFENQSFNDENTEDLKLEEKDNFTYKIKANNKHSFYSNKSFEVENQVETTEEEIEENLIEEDENFNEFLKSNFEEGEEILENEENKELNKINNSNESQEKKVKVKVNNPNTSSHKETEEGEENFFENDENSKTIKDVENINKNVSDVNLDVGQDVFGSYVSNDLEAKQIEEKEVVDIKEKVYNENSGHDVVDGMLYKNLDTVLHESMIPYSEHVILDRALPRVEDGLKPVQRRILYSMLELGVTPDKPFRKSARIVGDCLGKYHPHGDSSVYQAMVRMAQPFNTNELLVSGHGNFGSVDGDGAAAMRYTEARLAPLAMELLRDLDKNTVKWGLNFDDTLKEPEILPGRFPNLLVNGSTGIAVGLATNIPPHNLAEVIDGVVAYINSPSITLKEMFKIIKGPDFPTGAYILNNSELKQAYETGRGKIYLRAKMHIETNGNDKKYIVITELPYQVNKSSLLQKIATYREENKYGFGDISEIRDESDREGLRAVIRIKKDANLKTIYDSLLKNTELQTTFGINMVAIANGKPKQMGLLDIISYYAEYQREVILRRSKYDLEQAKEREHILSGLIIAIKNIDAVVKIIKTSANTTEAKKRLREKFVLSEKQAQAILDMRLARLTSLEVYKLEAELKKLRELIKELTAIINSKKLQFQIVKDELLQIKKQYKTDRRTKMMKAEESIKIASAEPEQTENQSVIILKSAKNNFKCVSLRQYNYAQKEVNENNTLFDIHVLKFETETNKTLLAFSNLGNCFKIAVKEIPEARYRDKGTVESKIFKELGSNETIVALFDGDDVKGKENLIFLTKFGMIKKTPLSEYALLKKYFQGMKLKDGDEITSIVKEPQNYTVVFVTKTGMVLNAENSDIPLQGRISGGVKGINLAAKDYCVGACLAGDGGEVVAVTDKGFAKRVLLSNIDKMARYRKGLKLFTFAKDNGNELVFGGVVTKPYTVICVGKEEEIYFRSTDLIPIEARIGKGKPVEKTKKNLGVTQAFEVRN